MVNSFAVCKYCRTGNLIGRKKCAICGENLDPTAVGELIGAKDDKIEDLIKFDPIPIELTIILGLNYFIAFILFILITPAYLDNFYAWFLIPFIFGIPIYLLYLIQKGNQNARIVFILLGILGIFILIDEIHYLAFIPIIAELGILAFDRRVINYCQL